MQEDSRVFSKLSRESLAFSFKHIVIKLFIATFVLCGGCKVNKSDKSVFKGSYAVNQTVITQGKNSFSIGNETTDLRLEGKVFSLHSFIYEENRDKIETRVAALKERELMEQATIGVDNNSIVFFRDYTRMITKRNNSYNGTLVLTDQAYQGLFYGNDNDSSLLLTTKNDVMKLEYQVKSFHNYDASEGKWVEHEISEIDEFYLVVWTDLNQNKVIDIGELGRAHIFFN